MKANEIQELFDSFEAIAIEYEGLECWSARELSGALGYVQWRNFQQIIEKAKQSCLTAGENVADHFADVSKMVALGRQRLLSSRIVFPCRLAGLSWWSVE